MGFWQFVKKIPWHFALVIALVLLAVGSRFYTRLPGQQRSDILVLATSDTFREFDPARSLSINDQRTLYGIFETLVRPGDQPGQVVPWLAESWQSDESGLVWEFTLRRGVTIHDGSELTAQTAVQALNRCWNQVSSGEFPYHRALLGKHVQPIVGRAEVVAPYVVRMKLRKPMADFLEILAQPAMALVWVNQASSPDSSNRYYGTGPYRVAECRPSQRLVLRRFPKYWHHYPSCERVIFRCIVDAGERRREVERGFVDIAFVVDSAPSVEPAQDAILWAHPGLAYWSLALNCSRLPFRDIRTRFGAQLCIDKSKIISSYLPMLSTVASGSLSPNSWADPTMSDRPCNVAKARAWFNKFYGKSIANSGEFTELLYNQEDVLLENGECIAEEIANQLSEAGARVQVAAVSSEDFMRRLATGTYQAASVVIEHSLTDPDVELSLHWAASVGVDGLVNVPRFSSERLTQKLAEARAMRTQSSRQQSYRRAMELLQEGAAEVPLAWITLYSAHRQNVDNVTMNRLNMCDYSEAIVYR